MNLNEKTDVITILVDVANEGHITNCYLVYDKESKKGIIIDPGYDYEKIISKIKDEDVYIEYIYLTHCHADHIGALEKLHEYLNCKILIHKNDIDGLFDIEKNYSEMLKVKNQEININYVMGVEDKYKFTVGNLEFEVIHTPGHTSGCTCLYESTNHILFTGDTIFSDCYGTTSLISGDFQAMKLSLDKVFNRFENIKIFPGHDEICDLVDAKKRIKLLLALKSQKHK